MPFGCLAPTDYYTSVVSRLLNVIVTDERYSRNASYALRSFYTVQLMLNSIQPLYVYIHAYYVHGMLL